MIGLTNDHRTNVHKKQEYKELCKHVRHAVRIDKEKWIDG